MSDKSKTGKDDRKVTAFLVGACDTELWGMTGSERAERMVRRAGIDDVAIGGYELEDDRSALIVRTEAVIDEALIPLLCRYDSLLLVADDGTGPKAVAAHVPAGMVSDAGALLREEPFDPERAMQLGLATKTPETLSESYNSALRKKAVPFVHFLDGTNTSEIEQATFDASYKGVTDFVTKWVWPKPAFPVTRFLARRGVTPNMVTLASFVCVLLALVLFARGDFLLGAFFGWMMAFLDTVDGKLARVTLTSSKWGNVFDHGIDLISPPFWWLAWWYGLYNHDTPLLFACMLIVVGGYVAGKLLEQAFISLFGIKTHMWQPIDSAFRQITARRNPNLAILTVFAIAGMPDKGYVVLAGWVVLCFAFHAFRLGQAWLQHRAGTPVRSWMDA